MSLPGIRNGIEYLHSYTFTRIVTTDAMFRNFPPAIVEAALAQLFEEGETVQDHEVPFEVKARLPVKWYGERTSWIRFPHWKLTRFKSVNDQLQLLPQRYWASSYI